jgi:predicted nucleic acid-binding protein
MSSVFISDTNIWIDFRNAGLLQSLFRLPFELCSTDFVIAELEDFDPDELVASGLIVTIMEEHQISELGNLTVTHNNSSLADVSCYLLARETGHPLLTGDGRLRKRALQDGVRVHGALWLLDQLVAEGVIDQARACAALTSMLGANARLPKDECDARLEMWSQPPPKNSSA